MTASSQYLFDWNKCKFALTFTVIYTLNLLLIHNVPFKLKLPDSLLVIKANAQWHINMTLQYVYNKTPMVKTTILGLPMNLKEVFTPGVLVI